ncbi:hypothetical protein PU629_07060 [Pullulanibacillus sp. KACC 23026]|uniref:hypothetical protein n=1 Tax=Pullulanibacillus sp. KACC 23026 TaxID=3028315 RepID=UPI0023AF7A14|nr:hypothetical protein [Pullulanibacillus sp. KACC 23026]WEG14118.1 hypothetical protein PU629_07060 [Pullulanibacillus sp. KACC 23026]
MSKIKSGYYDFFRCPSCDKDFAIANKDNQFDYYHCPICDTEMDNDIHWIGQVMIETGEN